jgi:hypothetical protein
MLWFISGSVMDRNAPVTCSFDMATLELELMMTINLVSLSHMVAEIWGYEESIAEQRRAQAQMVT